MAKSPSKSSAKEPKKAAAKTAKPKTTSVNAIEKVSVDAFNKLQALGIDQQLQNDLQWCIGSYRADGKPVGLYAMAERALDGLKAELAKKTKGVTAKQIADLEKAIRNH
jgi:hypothetical protein